MPFISHHVMENATSSKVYEHHEKLFPALVNPVYVTKPETFCRLVRIQKIRNDGTRQSLGIQTTKKDSDGLDM